jgi:hypothetical protein
MLRLRCMAPANRVRRVGIAAAAFALAGCGSGAVQQPTPLDAQTTTRAVLGDGSVVYSAGAYSLTLTIRDPQVSEDLQRRMAEVFFGTYPRMCARFNAAAPRKVSLVVEPITTRGVPAFTMGTTITVASGWIAGHPFDVDVVTHEAFHVLQGYPAGETPRWAIEGLADYGRHVYGVHNGAGGWKLPEYSAQQGYADSYRVTARFLLWLEIRVRPGIVDELHAALRSGRYSAQFWTTATTRTIDQLWAQYGRDPSL